MLLCTYSWIKSESEKDSTRKKCCQQTNDLLCVINVCIYQGKNLEDNLDWFDESEVGTQSLTLFKPPRQKVDVTFGAPLLTADS